jgi:hypothetical protein
MMREAMWVLSPVWLLAVYSWWMAIPSVALTIVPYKLRIVALLAGSAFHVALGYHVLTNSGQLCGPDVLSIHCEATVYVPVGWIINLTTFVIVAARTLLMLKIGSKA